MKLIYKILFTLIIAQLISLSGCVDRDSQNTGVERVINTRVIKIPDSELFNLAGFDSLYNPDYNNQRIIVQKPRNINGWSVMEPDIINIIYEKETKDSKDSIIKNNEDENIQNSLANPDDSYTIPVPTNYDQYSGLTVQDTDTDIIPNPDASYTTDE